MLDLKQNSSSPADDPLVDDICSCACHIHPGADTFHALLLYVLCLQTTHSHRCHRTSQIDRLCRTSSIDWPIASGHPIPCLTFAPKS